MKPSTLVTVVALLAGASAAVIKRGPSPTSVDPPTKVERDATCSAIFTGVNSEGGGGPGQSPIDNNNWGLSISGGSTSYFSDESPNGENGSFDFTVAAGDYGGAYDVDFTGQWNYGGNSWYYCTANANGVNSTGSIGDQSIDTGTVSTTTQLCTMVYSC